MKEEPAVRMHGGCFHQIGRVIMYRIDWTHASANGAAIRRQNRKTTIMISAVLPFGGVHDAASVRQPCRGPVIAKIEGQPAG